MNPDSLPSAYIIGFQKSGTTSIHNWLSQSNIVSLPKFKETHFFSDDSKYKRGIKWYLKQFSNNNKSKLKIEIDPSYIISTDALNRIKNHYQKSPKFIFILRRPLDRAYSHYLMSKYRGFEDLSFMEALEAEDYRLKNDNSNFSLLNYSYKFRSEYFYHIKKFKSIFKNSSILYLNFDDFNNKEKKNKMFNNIVNFLNIDEYIDIDKINLSFIANPRSSSKSLILRDLLYKEYFLKKIIRNILPEKIITMIKMNLDTINKKTDNSLTDFKHSNFDQKFYRWNNSEVEKIESLLSLNLKNWYY